MNYYPNSLCFSNRDMIKLKGGFESKYFDHISINIEICENKTRIKQNKTPCKSKQEIYKFIK